MSHPESSTAGTVPPENRMLWRRVFGLMLLAGSSVLVISLPSLANEDQQARPSAWFYCVLALIVAGLMSRTYILVRRSGFSKPGALSIAVVAVPASYVLAIALFFGLAAVLS
jgi:hypothetical protein